MWANQTLHELYRDNSIFVLRPVQSVVFFMSRKKIDVMFIMWPELDVLHSFFQDSPSIYGWDT
jgi:hypothetical protein